MSPRSIAVQVACYAAFAAFVGYFSAAPAYHPIAPGHGLVKLSFTHAGDRKQPCRERSAEELAKLATNMRSPLDCSRERSDVRVEIEMDGELLYRIQARAPGLRHDLAASVYRRFEVPAGRHVFRARLADGPSGDFTHHGEATVDLATGRVLVIDFAAGRGGFLFRS